MSKEKQKETPVPEAEEPVAENADEAVEGQAEETVPADAGADALKAVLAAQEDKYLRLAAEYDNFRKRSAKEKESAWADAKGETAAAFLPVYDNLERALKQETGDEAYKKGVEMTMNQLKEVFSKLGITEIPALGEPFDPNVHNAVLHVEDDSVEENTIVEVFQAGFKNGEKVLRFAMVKVAN